MKSQIAQRITTISLVFVFGLLFAACSSGAQDGRHPQSDDTSSDSDQLRKLQEWRDRRTRH